MHRQKLHKGRLPTGLPKHGAVAFLNKFLQSAVSWANPHCGATPQPPPARASLPAPGSLQRSAQQCTPPSSRSARPWPWPLRARESKEGRAEAGGGGTHACSLQSIGSLTVVSAPRRSRRRGGPRQAAGAGLSLWQKGGKRCGVAGGELRAAVPCFEAAGSRSPVACLSLAWRAAEALRP